MPEQVFHRTFLEFGNRRYLKGALVLSAAAVLAFVAEPAGLVSFGASPTGLALGTLGAILILWLMGFGIRKRRYRSRLGTVQGWLSAHVYLGASLIVVATLHTGFQAGWNVHSLAYALTMIVIASGFWGVQAYLRLPSRLTEVMGDDTIDTIFLKLASLDLEARALALHLSDEVNAAVLLAGQATRVGGGVLSQLRGVDSSCPTDAAVRLVRSRVSTFHGADSARSQELYAVLVRKSNLLARARRAVMFKARMDVWLYVHVPLSFALLAALAAHILSVFVYPS